MKLFKDASAIDTDTLMENLGRVAKKEIAYLKTFYLNFQNNVYAIEKIIIFGADGEELATIGSYLFYAKGYTAFTLSDTVKRYRKGCLKKEGRYIKKCNNPYSISGEASVDLYLPVSEFEEFNQYEQVEKSDTEVRTYQVTDIKVDGINFSNQKLLTTDYSYEGIIKNNLKLLKDIIKEYEGKDDMESSKELHKEITSLTYKALRTYEEEK